MAQLMSKPRQLADEFDPVPTVEREAGHETQAVWRSLFW